MGTEDMPREDAPTEDAPTEDAAAAKPGNEGKITAEEYLKHATVTDLWLLIGDKVFDVTKYQEEHPGSDSILHDVKGMDATQEFDDVGHSMDAISKRDTLIVGDFDMSTIDQLPGYQSRSTSSGGDGGVASALGPILFIVLIGVLAVYFK